jgi:hypothetical protein
LCSGSGDGCAQIVGDGCAQRSTKGICNSGSGGCVQGCGDMCAQGVLRVYVALVVVVVCKGVVICVLNSGL